jgi:hypothetical protein
MNPYLKTAKVFAFLTLIFSGSSGALAQAENSIYRLPAGTSIWLRMDAGVSSNVSTAEDTFTATLAKPVVVRETIVLPTGTIVEGRVIKARAAAPGGQSGKLEIRIERIRFADGQSREIDGRPVKALKAPSVQAGNIISVVGGTALGALFGAVTKTSNGALIGAGIGAGAGTGVALMRKGRNVRIKDGEEFEITLKKDVTLPVADY